MSVKGGAILHDANGYVIDRIQTGGASSVNQATEKIYELGNWLSVETIRDIPDLTFDVESFDMSCEFEAILTGQDPTTVNDGDEFDFNNSLPVDIISPFKSDTNAFDIVKGIAIPYLNLERVSYRFGVRQNSTQQFGLKGDAIYYIPGTPYYQKYTNTGAGAYTFTNTALEYVESGDSVYALSVCIFNTTTNVSKRLVLGDDYTNTSAGFTLLASEQATYNQIGVVYGSATAATYPQSVHVTSSVLPGAIRGKDIDIYIGSSDATPVFERWTSVQSVEVTRSVNLEADEELGNAHYVTQDYVTADVTGTIAVKPSDAADLFDKVQQIADIASNKIVGPFTSALLPIEIRVSDPNTGLVIKTLYVPDARFTIPGVQGRANAKLEVSIPFSSDGGQLLVYRGER